MVLYYGTESTQKVKATVYGWSAHCKRSLVSMLADIVLFLNVLRALRILDHRSGEA